MAKMHPKLNSKTLPVIDTLEPRRLLHGDLSVGINFAPLGSPRAPGLLLDYGSTYDVRREGLSYGWNFNPAAGPIVGEYNAVSESRKNNGFIDIRRDASWEIAVADGDYEVYAVGGDQSAPNERMGLLAEGQVVFAGTTRIAKPFLEGAATVSVTDGRLTVSGAGDFGFDKINYIAIRSIHLDGKTIGITTTANADENGPVIGRMRIERTGGLDEALAVGLQVGGTATNSVDYGRVGSLVTFRAGVSAIDLPIAPVVDNLVEGDETLTVTLGRVPGYSVIDATASLTITDGQTTPPPSPPPTPPPTPPTFPSSFTWTTGPSLPAAASEIISAEIGGNLYTFGGFVDQTFRPTTAARKFNPSTNTWSPIAPLSVGLTHAGVATDDDSIYFAGGYPGSGNNGNQVFSTKKVFKYTPATNTYADLPDLPAARGAGMAAVLNNKLYYISGDNSSRADVRDVYRLDLADLSAGWITRTPLPAARNHAAAVTLGGSIYVAGGQTGQDAGLTAQKSLFRYDASTSAWTTLANLPAGRSHVTDSAFVHNGRIVLLGGQSAYESPVSSNVAYNPADNTWSTLTPLPAARFSGAGHLLGNGKYYYTGGYNGTFKTNTYVGTPG